MGFYLCLEDDNGKDIPEWNFKGGYDRDFTHFDFGECEAKRELICPWDNADIPFRPKSTEGIRRQIDATDWDPEVKQRYHKLCDYVDNGSWITFSY